MAHRHRISLIGDDASQTGTQPGADYLGVLDGSFFAAANGYAGPGRGHGAGRLLHRHLRGPHGGLHAGAVHERVQRLGDLVRGALAADRALRLPLRRDRLHAEHADARDAAPVVGGASAASGSKLHTLATQPLLDAPDDAERSHVQLAVQPGRLRRRHVDGRDDRRGPGRRRRGRRRRADAADLLVQRPAPRRRLDAPPRTTAWRCASSPGGSTRRRSTAGSGGRRPTTTTTSRGSARSTSSPARTRSARRPATRATARPAGPTATACSCTRARTRCSRRARTASPGPSRACGSSTGGAGSRTSTT